MIHGGAGELDHINNSNEAEPYLSGIRSILENGRDILEQGGLALDAVETCAAMLENNPLFNSGHGSALNERGEIELDAAIMDGRDLNAGAVAGINRVKNPVKLARLVLTESKHVMLIGDGALQFANQHNVKIVADSDLITEQRYKQYEKAHATNSVSLAGNDDINREHGTIGAVAYDKKNNLAAATSTGGTINKKWGRVGDSPIIGAGVYADNNTCAVSTTGYGEDFMRTVLAKYISDLIELKNLDSETAVKQGINYLKNRVNGCGGMIVIDKHGKCASQFTTRTMIHGWIEYGGQIESRFKQ